MIDAWNVNELIASPVSIRPETQWLYEIMELKNSPLWFSLRLSKAKAEELRDAFIEGGREGTFANLIANGVRMARSTHAALCFALDTNSTTERFGTDMLVPREALAILQQLADDHRPDIEITDAGLAVEGDQSSRAPLERFPPRRPATRVNAGSTSGPVIIAIIDDGVGIANHRFRSDPTHTRVQHFLDLALPCAESEPPWSRELLARSWTKSQIDALLDRYPDDEQVYRALGLIGGRQGRQPLRAAVSHGTHMLDTAAGYDYRNPQELVAANDRPVIAVQLPPQVAEDGSDAWKPQSVKRAFDWILVRADELSNELTKGKPGGPRRLPLIVNCSFGSMAGPQDGESDVERRITQFVETYRGGHTGPKELCMVVLSAGNSLQTRAAAELRFTSGSESQSILWRILPDDKTSSFVQIWTSATDLPKQSSGNDLREQRVEVSLMPPGGGPATSWSQLDRALDCMMQNKVCARVYHQAGSREPNRYRECITIAVRPTADDGDPEPVAPAGLWRIDIRTRPSVKLTETMKIDLRVHRDDAGLFARGKARQSYFDDPLYERFDPITGRAMTDETAEQARRLRGEPTSQVTLRRTLGVYSAAAGTLVVAGYRHSDGLPAPYSSSGPTRRVCTGPDIAAVTEESPAFRGILAAGTYSGSVAILNGTSVAAPLVTRALADIIGSGSPVETLYTRLATSGPHDVYPPAVSRPLRFGRGHLSFPPQPPHRRRIDDHLPAGNNAG